MSPLPTIPPADGYNHLTWPDGTHDVKFKWQPDMQQSISLKTIVHEFDGRQWPLAYWGEHSMEEFNVSFMFDKLVDGDQFSNLRTLVDGAFSRTVLVWTDVFGNQFNCVVTVEPITRRFVLGGAPVLGGPGPLGGRYQTVSFKVTRVE